MKNIVYFITIILVLLLASCTNVEKEIIISFNSMEGTSVPSMNYDDISQDNLPIPLKEGYTFIGWYIDSEYKTAFEENNPLNSSITLYAKWSINTYIITYVFDDTESVTSSYTYSEDIQLPNPRKPNLKFDGWYLDYEKTVTFDLAKMPAKDLTLHAKWVNNGTNQWLFNILSETENLMSILLKIQGDVDFVGFDAAIYYNHASYEIQSIENPISAVINDTEIGTILFNYVDVMNPNDQPVDIMVINFKKLNSNEELSLNLVIKEMISMTEQYDVINVDYEITPFSQ